MKKALSLLLVLAMVISMAPAVFAAEASPVITGQPKDVTANENALVTFTVEAEGENLTYQWQFSKNGGTSWTNSTSATEGYNAKTLVLSAGLVRNGWMYRCVVTNAGGSVTSEAATLSVIVAESKVEITSQPKDTTVPEGEMASFTVGAVGDDLSYQWQFSTNDGKSWKYSSAATQGYNEKTLVVKSTPGRNGYSFRCIVSNADGASTITKKAKLTMGVPVVDFEIKSHPQDVTAFENALVTFTVEAEGEALKYQWQYSKDSGGTWINSTSATEGYNAKTLVLSAGLVRKGWMYRCVVSNASGSAITEAATLSVVEAPSKVEITSQPQSATVPEGSYGSFTVEAVGDDLSYQWQFSTNDGKSWKYSSAATQGYNEKTLVVKSTPGRNGYSFRCIITKADGSTAISKKAKMTMGEVVLDITINNQPADVTAVVGTNATFTVEATGENLTYQWQFSKDAGASWRNSSEATQGYNEKTLIVGATAARNGWMYRCVITNATGSVTSEAATLTVNEATPLEIVTQPTAQTAALGANAEFIVVANGDELTYQWQTLVGEAWVDIADATAATLSVTASEENDGAQYKCVITDKHGESVTSEAAALTVEYPQGHMYNPHMINVMGVPYECQTGEVAAGATYYASISNGYSAPNMVIENANVNVIYKGETYAPVDGVVTVPLAPCYRMPNNVEIVNKGTEAASYTLKFEYPLGSMENPEIVTDLSFFYAPQAEGDIDGYYFKWTAPEAGILTLSLSNYAEGADYNAYITVGYTQYNWAEEAVEGVLNIEVAEGDEVIINAFTISQYEIDENWNVVYDEEGNPVVVYNPESSVYINGAFVNGGINYPYDLSPENIPGSAVTNVIEAGASEYYTTTANGTVITFNTQNVSVEYDGTTYTAVDGVVSFYVEGGFDPMTRMPKPIVFKVTNIGENADAFTANYTYPVGHSENPDTLVIGENVSTFDQGDEPYYYTWTAVEDGEVTITISAENGWFYCVNNLTAYAYGNNNYYNDTEVVNSVTLSVEAGNVLQVIVSSYDADLWGSCDGSVTVNASFEADVVIEEEVTTPDDGEE